MLSKLGAKDSKKLTAKKRRDLYKLLVENAVDFVTIHLSAKEIDNKRKNSSLNEIEQRTMINAVKKLKVKPDEIYIDAADVKEKRYGEEFKKIFPNAEIISKHKADAIFPVVSAASIIAKVQRDNEIEKIKEKLNQDIGSGYPSDPKTREFLKRYYLKHRRFPEFVRTSWDTTNKIKEECKKKTILDYF